MGTNAAESEKVLAQLACEHLSMRADARVLIGGLGFGFSLRQVLALVPADAQISVAELLPEVVAWNRQYLHAINGLSLDDKRVEVLIEDVFHVISRAPAAHYDAILLDVDNGPVAMVQNGNERLYQARGFSAIQHALKPGGRVTFWSASSDHAFARRLAKAGFKVSVVPAKAWPQAKRCTHTIFVADRR